MKVSASLNMARVDLLYILLLLCSREIQTKIVYGEIESIDIVYNRGIFIDISGRGRHGITVRPVNA